MLSPSGAWQASKPQKHRWAHDRNKNHRDDIGYWSFWVASPFPAQHRGCQTKWIWAVYTLPRKKRLKSAEQGSYFWQTSDGNCWTGRSHTLTSISFLFIFCYICNHEMYIYIACWPVFSLFIGLSSNYERLFASRAEKNWCSIASKQLGISTSR